MATSTLKGVMNCIVSLMTPNQLRKELKVLRGFEPQAPWMQDRIKDIEAELRVRASFHY
ncbi:MAG: hypothetical protein WC807_18515 [Hyphomicrobium sp.]|jgi:hypothetical protein